MDTAQIAVLLGGTLLIIFTLWFFFGHRDDEEKATTLQGQPISECPMHPWITSIDPSANCSICGMKLVRRGDARGKRDVHPAGHNEAHH